MTATPDPGRAAPPSARAPVSIVVPTVGRLELLAACLDSLARCEPPAEEIVVVDQSGGDEVSRLVESYRFAGARRVHSGARGTSAAMNLGLRSCGQDFVLVTHDDCTAERSWAGLGAERMGGAPDAIVTGRVRPAGDPEVVPSHKDDPRPHDFTGELQVDALYPNNMALNRRLALEMGGFDERLRWSEDNDLCYRWLRAGRPLRYEPDLVVWHHDWRSPRELERLYLRYSVAQGELYAKHLRDRDLKVVRFLVRDLYRGCRGFAVGLVRRRPAWRNPRVRILGGLLPGLVRGWRTFSSRGEGPRASRRP